MKSIFFRTTIAVTANSNTFSCIFSFFIHPFKLRPLVITNIYGVFIETIFFIFPAVLQKEFFQNILMVQTPFSGNRLFTKKANIAVPLGHVVT